MGFSLVRKDPQYSSGVEREPELDRHLQSSVAGLHIAGAAKASPLLKTCINEGVEVVRCIARLEKPGAFGAGPTGLAAALEAHKQGFSTCVLEKQRPLETIRNFPPGKHVYAEPAGMRTLGGLWLEDATKEELLARWGTSLEGPDCVYSVLMTVFGLKALRRWRVDPCQRKRLGTLIAAQWLVYFALPWMLWYAFAYPVYWRAWAVGLTYPLGYYGLWEPAGQLFSDSVLPWTIGVLVAFAVFMPIFSAFHGKRFCAWFCPCGGLADTVGDAWRHKAPRGKAARAVEISSSVILATTSTAAIGPATRPVPWPQAWRSPAVSTSLSSTPTSFRHRTS